MTSNGLVSSITGPPPPRSKALPPATQAAPTNDPFSTPARRRRIIADVAKFLLRQYCVKACDNVVRFRQWTKASTAMQCAWRCHSAHQRLSRLRFARRHTAAIVVQRAVRGLMARRELRRRRLAEWTRRATALALALQAAVRWHRRERRKKEDRALHRARMLRRKHAAALVIQQLYRGTRGRRAALLRRQLQSELYRRRHFAAITVQSCWRRMRAKGFVQARRRRRRAQWKVTAYALCWQRRWRAHRVSACINMQRICRGFLGRARVRQAREARARALWEAAERRRLEALRLAALAAAEEAATRRIEVRLAVKLAILKRISVLGPAEAVLWSLKHKILRYGTALGYSLGAVLVQVVGTVESVFPTLIARPASRCGGTKEEASVAGAACAAQGDARGDAAGGDTGSPPARPIPGEGDAGVGPTEPSDRGGEELGGDAPAAPDIVDVDAQHKCITLRKWRDDDDGAADADDAGDAAGAGAGHLPRDWQQTVQRGRGAEVSVARSARSIDLRVKISADAFALRGDNPIRWTVVTIVLEGEAKDAPDIGCSSLLDCGDLPTAVLPDDDADFRFRFRDTVVLLQRPAKVAAVKEEKAPVVEVEVAAEEGPSGPPLGSPMGDSIASSQDSPHSPEVQSPQEHRITITIEPDYGAAACTIQGGCRDWLDLRRGAREVIRRCWRRRRRLKKWRKVVRKMLRRANRAATRMQRIVRRVLAARQVAARRLQVCTRLASGFARVTARLTGNLSGVKFAAQSEAACWAAFGLGAAAAEEHVGGAGVEAAPRLDLGVGGAGTPAAAAAAAAALRVLKRNAAVRGMMSIARLPPAPPGVVPLFAHLVAVAKAKAPPAVPADGAPGCAHAYDVPGEGGWGAVASLSMPEVADGPAEGGEGVATLGECSFPEVFVGIARRRDQTDR